MKNKTNGGLRAQKGPHHRSSIKRPIAIQKNFDNIHQLGSSAWKLYHFFEMRVVM